MTRAHLHALATLAALGLAAAPAARAQLTGPAYPPPGGVTFTPGSGNTGTSPGKTNTYSGFTPSAYGSLYFGLDDTANIVESFDGNRGDTLTFSSGQSNLAQGQLVWTGTTVMYTNVGTFPSIATRFTLNLTDTSGNPLALTPAASVGLPSNVGGVLPVSGSYKATLLFEAVNPSSGQYAGANAVFSSYGHVGASDTGSAEIKSFSGGFYSTPAPEPSAWAGLAVGALMLGASAICVRRRSAALKSHEG